MKRSRILAFILPLICMGNALAFVEDHDEYSLELKGFSPELIEPVQIQINRMEGRYPESPPSIRKQALYNFLNGEWVESFERFSQDKINPPSWPKRP